MIGAALRCLCEHCQGQVIWTDIREYLDAHGITELELAAARHPAAQCPGQLSLFEVNDV